MAAISNSTVIFSGLSRENETNIKKCTLPVLRCCVCNGDFTRENLSLVMAQIGRRTILAHGLEIAHAIKKGFTYEGRAIQYGEGDKEEYQGFIRELDRKNKLDSKELDYSKLTGLDVRAFYEGVCTLGQVEIKSKKLEGVLRGNFNFIVTLSNYKKHLLRLSIDQEGVDHMLKSVSDSISKRKAVSNNFEVNVNRPVLRLVNTLEQKPEAKKIADVEIVSFQSNTTIPVKKIMSSLQVTFKITLKLNTGREFEQEINVMYPLDSESTFQFSLISLN